MGDVRGHTLWADANTLGAHGAPEVQSLVCLACGGKWLRSRPMRGVGAWSYFATVAGGAWSRQVSETDEIPVCPKHTARGAR